MKAAPDSNTAKNGGSSRTRRFVIASISFLFLALIATQIFLHQTSVGSPRFTIGTILLWTATVLVVLALLILATVLGRNLVKLYFERKIGKVGSRFKTKIVSTFIVLSLLPALLLFLLAYGLINFSIQQWFSAPTTQMLENSTGLEQQYYQESRQRASHFAARIAEQVRDFVASPADAPNGLARELGRLSDSFLIDYVEVFSKTGLPVDKSGEKVSLSHQDPVIEKLVARALNGEADSVVQRISPDNALREVLWAATPVRSAEGEILGAVLTEVLIPDSAQFKAYSVREAIAVYDQLRERETALHFNVLLILAISTLLIVFAFSWFAMYLAKRITVPIQALAEGAAAVAAGKLEHRVECRAFDELENLVMSFNQMTGELQENKRNIEQAQDVLQQTNVELDGRRRYIETILQTIATGVVSLDSSLRIRTLNPAAIQMLEIRDGTADLQLDQVVQGDARDTLHMLLHRSSVLGSIVRNIELKLPGKSLHLATTVTPLVDGLGNKTGWVLVLDDLTELLRVEKMAAWQEVARRLAHEIKNPLTPIQLSAERVLNRYKQIGHQIKSGGVPQGHWQAEFASFDGLLKECIHTITQEANSLKNLVDEFSRFARLPEPRPEWADLHQILDSSLNLYNGRIDSTRVETEFDYDIPPLRLDPGQMKRVFINLLDNALEAMSDNLQPKVLQVRTKCNKAKGSVRIEISDTGRGFPEEYRDSLFLPYFSTRKGGTGLGLAIVRQIVTDHHGRVHAEPNEELGTRLVIDLPLAPVR